MSMYYITQNPIVCFIIMIQIEAMLEYFKIFPTLHRRCEVNIITEFKLNGIIQSRDIEFIPLLQLVRLLKPDKIPNYCLY